MSEGIPEHVDLVRAAKMNRRYKGVFKVAKMLRLCDYLASKNGQVEVDISFSVEGGRGLYLRGHAKAEVEVLCQRCMQVMPHDIETSFELQLVEREHELERVPEEVDALLVAEVPSSLVNIVEDELILGFSIVPMHAEDQCEATSFMKAEQALIEQQKEEEKPNPFTVLKDFKIEG